jgi:hypothetical protein
MMPVKKFDGSASLLDFTCRRGCSRIEFENWTRPKQLYEAKSRMVNPMLDLPLEANASIQGDAIAEVAKHFHPTHGSQSESQDAN